MASNPIMDAINATPPVTRFYAFITLGLSLACHVFRLVDPGLLIYHSNYLTHVFPPQLWRLFTSFFLTGPKLAIVFDTYMIYNYGKDLEQKKFRTSGDMLVYLGFVGSVILLINTFILEGMIFCAPMGLAMIYTWSQSNRNLQVNFWFVPLKAQFMPFAIMAFALLSDGPGSAIMLGGGLVAAHLYEFLTVIWPTFGGGRNWLATPAWLANVSFDGGPQTGERGYGTAVDPRQRQAQRSGAQRAATVGMFSGAAPGAATGRAGGAGNPAATARSAWTSRGGGQRLGDS